MKAYQNLEWPFVLFSIDSQLGNSSITLQENFHSLAFIAYYVPIIDLKHSPISEKMVVGACKKEII